MQCSQNWKVVKNNISKLLPSANVKEQQTNSPIWSLKEIFDDECCVSTLHQDCGCLYSFECIYHAIWTTMNILKTWYFCEMFRFFKQPGPLNQVKIYYDFMTIIHVFCKCDYVGMILLKSLKISMTLIFLFQTLKRCLEFSRTILLHIYFFVWNTIFMYINLEAQNPHLLDTQLISRVIKKLNIILLKTGGNFQIILKNGGLIFNFFFFFFFLQYHFISWGSTMCFPLLLDCLFIVYRSDSVTLNTISCDNCCKIYLLLL